MSLRFRPGALLVLCLWFHGGLTAESTWTGISLQDYIAVLRDQGLRVIYSSDLVPDSLLVLQEPRGLSLSASLQSVLQPYRLTLTDGPSGSLLITPDHSIPDASPATSGRDQPTQAKREPLAEVVVTSSRYKLRYEIAGSHAFLGQELTNILPDLGDEPVRAVLRLPGIANGGVSTRNHIRGGLDNEQLFLVDGLRLYEPYHLKDFHSVSTIVNQNVIAGIDLYSAGYQARFGDRMSGVVNINIVEPPTETVTELGLSFFNASILSMGRFGAKHRGDWLVSLRRGNLDLIADAVNPELGAPQYEDLFARAGWELGARSYLSFNLLMAYDKIAIGASDGGEHADAKYFNNTGWLRLQTDWTDLLSTTTILSLSNIDNTRIGNVSNPGILSGQVDETKEFESAALKQDWQFNPSDIWSFSAGFNLRRLDANYRYDSLLSITPPFDQIFDNRALTIHSINVSPSGGQYAVYLESRWRPLDSMIIDLGIRWDQQTYTTADDDDQISPRINILYRFGRKTALKLGFGQFYQAQEINELQISDGIESFFPAQRARHLVASLSHTFDSALELRFELYQKRYHSLMPRFENVLNPLVLLPELQIDRVRIAPIHATAQGAELMLSGERKKLLWWLSYTWADIEDDLDGGTARRSWDQKHSLKAGGHWDWKKWNLSISGEIHSGWPNTGLITETIVNPDGSSRVDVTATKRNSLRHSVFHTVDARLSRQFDVSRGKLTGFFEITNLYNRRNSCCTDYIRQSGPNGTDLVREDQDNWLPLLVSLGVSWRF